MRAQVSPHSSQQARPYGSEQTLDKPGQRAYGGPMTSTSAPGANHDFRIGDIVSVSFKIESELDADGEYHLAPTNAGRSYYASPEDMTLVEHPQPKVAVELTYDELNDLCIKTAILGWDDPLYQALCAARHKAHNERS